MDAAVTFLLSQVFQGDGKKKRWTGFGWKNYSKIEERKH